MYITKAPKLDVSYMPKLKKNAIFNFSSESIFLLIQ